VLQLPDPPNNLEDIPALCSKDIATIINKANRKLGDSLRNKEEQLYKKSHKRYHNNLKTSAGLQSNAKDQPKLEAIHDPTTNEITTHPPRIVDILQTHFEKKHSRNTLDHIPPPAWQNPLSPDPSSLEDIPALCKKAIATIINKANRKLADFLRKKEDHLYKKSPKRYHNNLKTAVSLQPNAKD